VKAVGAQIDGGENVLFHGWRGRSPEGCYTGNPTIVPA
jgi:hypothetical protein